MKPDKKYEEVAPDPVERIGINLTPAKERKLCVWIDDHREGMEQDRRDFLERQRRYLYQWDDFVSFTRKGPWDNSSNLHMPLTAIKVKSYWARLYNLFTQENTAKYVPRETTDEKHTEMITKLRNWYLWGYLNCYKGIRGFAREVFYDCVTVGFGIGMKDWENKVRKIIDVEPAELHREMEDLSAQVKEAPEDIFLTDEEATESQIDTKTYKEVEKIITVFEGTRLRSIPFENAYFPNYIPESNDLDFPPVVVISTKMQVSDVNLKGKTGEWDKKKVKRVIQSGDQSELGTEAREIEEHRQRLSGVDDISEWSRQDQRIIEYVFCSYDIDGDGINEELIVTKCGTTIIKVAHLDRISPSGHRPLFKFDCFTKPRQAYSRGIPEFLYPLNEEMDQHHNMRIDYLTLQTCPFGVYRATSSLKNDPIQISPGKFIPADETSDMKVLNFNTNATALNSEEDRGWQYADLLTSTSSLNQGIIPDRVGPARSTSGVLTLLRQMDKEFIVTVDQNADQWKKLEKMCLDDLDYRVDTDVKVRVLGASEPEAIMEKIPDIGKKLMINSQFDFHIDVARAVTSEEVLRNDAEMILQMVAAPSLMQQMGIVTPKTMHRALSDWLKSFGKDPNNYIKVPEYVDTPLTLFQEIQVCAQGGMPPMALQDQHDVKAQHLLAFLQTPEYIEAKNSGMYSQHTDEMIVKAAQKHSMLFEMTQPKGLPNPSGANAQNNTQVLSGTAPQQGGQNPNQTTGRDDGQGNAGVSQKVEGSEGQQ